MKIAWFTPFVKQSAIGEYSQVVTKLLSQYHDITLYVQKPQDDSELRSTSCTLQLYENSNSLNLRDFDHIIYNFGDHLAFHKVIYEVFLQNPGICVLHDLTMLNFFSGYYQQSEQILSFIKIFYHKKVNKIQASDLERFPLLELLDTQATGYITHGTFVENYVQDTTNAPITNLNFPYFTKQSKQPTIKKSVTDKVHLLTIGYVNENKRIHATIQAIAESQILRKNVHFDIVGPYDTNGVYYQKLAKLIQKHSLENIVTLHGYQSEPDLKKFLHNADIFINLRYPALNASSWSFVEELAEAKPIIISDSKMYNAIPNNIVKKIPTNYTEIIQLKNALESLIQDTELRKRLGAASYAFAHNFFSEVQYIKGFNHLLNEVDKYKHEKYFMLSVEQNIKNISFNTNLNFYKKLSELIEVISKGQLSNP